MASDSKGPATPGCPVLFNRNCQAERRTKTATPARTAAAVAAWAGRWRSVAWGPHLELRPRGSQVGAEHPKGAARIGGLAGHLLAQRRQVQGALLLRRGMGACRVTGGCEARQERVARPGLTLPAHGRAGASPRRRLCSSARAASGVHKRAPGSSADHAFLLLENVAECSTASKPSCSCGKHCRALSTSDNALTSHALQLPLVWHAGPAVPGPHLQRPVKIGLLLEKPGREGLLEGGTQVSGTGPLARVLDVDEGLQGTTAHASVQIARRQGSGLCPAAHEPSRLQHSLAA